jgi:hypothetical protein
MSNCRFRRFVGAGLLAFCCFCANPSANAQGARQTVSETPIADADADHVQERNAWFFRGRVIPGRPSAELRHRAYQAKMQLRAQRRRATSFTANSHSTLPPPSSGSWIPLGPVPLASDASGSGFQDYHQVSGRATAVAIDPADPTGNTLYIGGAQGGVWQSTNAADAMANNVLWTPVTDDQATLSIGSIAIQPGNSDPTKSLILVGTGEADNSGDSYFGLGILRSTDAGTTWTLIPTANNGALSFSGLGGTRMAFSTASGQTNTVVSAMATSSVGMDDGAVTANTERGLYTSLDAGQSWTYNALVDLGGATDATSSTSVVYNATAGMFFAAIRYHGFYSSPDGTHWTRLTNQPGGAALSTTACPAQSTSNNRACPIYRGEITVVPGRNEMYVWYIHISSTGTPIDGGIWQSLNGGASWAAISETGITNCGSEPGCGVQQAYYNLELLAVPSGSATDLYAGTINIYKCSITSANPTCASAPFLNLTHVYGCTPIAAPAHVHPDQHALAYVIPTSGGDSGNALIYFANDGGIYRALNAFSGLNSGSCSGLNQFDDLNQNLGSMTQFVSFSQHPTDPNTVLGGTQDNGSPATSTSTTSTSWINVNGGDGGYNAIDPLVPADFFTANPDTGNGTLNIQGCSSGVNCRENFSVVVGSNSVGGDDGAFYFPYVLDAQSSTALLVGTCRVWRGPRVGGAYTLLSPNFDTFGTGTCSGSEINLVRALAAGGPTDSNGSKVIYATTDGFGPLTSTSPTGGHVWITTNATAGSSAFAEVSQNINPNQFPVSSVAIDGSDATGNTAYVTVMGFTGGPGHVWKTTNAGAVWTDFTANLPDSPVNAVMVDATNGTVYVGSDVGVFVTGTTAANWIEVGPDPSSGLSGFLPNVAVSALAIFNSGGQKLLRASTYGRGIWQSDLAAGPDFQLAVSNTPLILFPGQSSAFNGTVTAVNGYNNPIALSCTAGTTSPPNPCAPFPAVLNATTNTPFTIAVPAGPITDYDFNVQGVGMDSNHTTHTFALALHYVNFAMTIPAPSTVTVPRGTTSTPVSFQITAAGFFNQSVAVSCSVNIPSSVCTLTPGTSVNPTSSAPVNMTASVTVPAATTTGSYPVTLQATTNGAPAALTTSFTLNVVLNPDFILTEPTAFPEVNAGSTGTNGPITITSQDGFSGTVTLSCPITFGATSCSVSPMSVSTLPATVTLTINGTSLNAGTYQIAVTGISGSVTHSVGVPFNVGDYLQTGTQSLTAAPGTQITAGLTLTSSTFYSGQINAVCDASALSGTICTVAPTPVTVTSGGAATLTATINVPNNASPGNYNININTQDTTGAPSHSSTTVLTVIQDFVLSSSTASQTVTAGQTTGAYNLTIQPVGASFDSAITLTCGGLPGLAQCLFNPSGAITPGSSAAAVVMSISTTATTTQILWPGGHNLIWYAFLLAWPGIVIVWRAADQTPPRKRRTFGMMGALLLFLLSLPSCGGGSNGGGSGNGGHQGTKPGNYTVTVTATAAGNITHGTTVGLVVQQ